VTTIHPGDVLSLDGNKMRVLCADDVEILYDAWWDHTNSWGLAKPVRAASYYRVPTELAKRAKRLAKEPLTPDEAALHRPDLPLRLLRRSGWVFTTKRYASLKSFAVALGKKKLESLDAPKIVVRPRGPVRGHKAGVALEADNGRAFVGVELLWKMHEAQAPHIRAPRDDGSGLYRLGCERGVPSFYIHGDIDAAGYLAD
jgi:hypothetical protein